MNEQGQTKESEGDPFMNFTSFTMPTKGAFKKMTRKGGKRIRISEGLLYVGKRYAPRPFLEKRPFPDAKVKEGLKVSQAGRRSDISAWEIKVCQGGGTTASELFGGLLSVHVVFLVGSPYSSIQTNPCSSPSANAQKTKEIQTLLPPSLCLTLSQRTKGGKRKRTERDTNKEEEDDEKVLSRSEEGLPD